MNRDLLHTILQQFQVNFLAYFSALTQCDLHTILAGESETLLTVLQARYGYTQAQAKAAWNDFVLRYVDGQPAEKTACS
jgi:hypothetical protein